MTQIVQEAATYTNISASALVANGPGAILGIFVASASSTPTLKVWGAVTAAAPIIVNTFTPLAGTFYPIPAHFQTGLYVTIGGTVDCTVFWSPRFGG